MDEFGAQTHDGTGVPSDLSSETLGFETEIRSRSVEVASIDEIRGSLGLIGKIQDALFSNRVAVGNSQTRICQRGDFVMVRSHLPSNQIPNPDCRIFRPSSSLNLRGIVT